MATAFQRAMGANKNVKYADAELIAAAAGREVSAEEGALAASMVDTFIGQTNLFTRDWAGLQMLTDVVSMGRTGSARFFPKKFVTDTQTDRLPAAGTAMSVSDIAKLMGKLKVPLRADVVAQLLHMGDVAATNTKVLEQYHMRDVIAIKGQPARTLVGQGSPVIATTGDSQRNYEARARLAQFGTGPAPIDVYELYVDSLNRQPIDWVPLNGNGSIPAGRMSSAVLEQATRQRTEMTERAKVNPYSIRNNTTGPLATELGDYLPGAVNAKPMAQLLSEPGLRVPAPSPEMWKYLLHPGTQGGAMLHLISDLLGAAEKHRGLVIADKDGSLYAVSPDNIRGQMVDLLERLSMYSSVAGDVERGYAPRSVLEDTPIDRFKSFGWVEGTRQSDNSKQMLNLSTFLYYIREGLKVVGAIGTDVTSKLIKGSLGTNQRVASFKDGTDGSLSFLPRGGLAVELRANDVRALDSSP